MRFAARSILCLLLAACDAGKAAQPQNEAGGNPAPAVTVFAAASLKELLAQTAEAWGKTSGGEVRFQFEASSTLARQIKEGAPADLFVTAAPEWLDQLNILARYDWLSNRLVCVVRKERAEFDLKKVDSLALANEQVPAGKYAKAALSHLGITLPGRMIYGSNVRDVLSKVSEGGAQAGIVYATDAAIDPRVRIAYTFPEESHPRILYSVAILTENGRDLAAFLRAIAPLEAARRMGFIVIQ